MHWKSMKRCRTLIHRMITEQQVKNKQIKRKRVNVFKFQENKFQIVQNNLQEIKMILIKKRFGKTTSCNDHYMINMGGQRPKTGGNWLSNGPYLQCWTTFGQAQVSRKHFCFPIQYSLLPHYIIKYKNNWLLSFFIIPVFLLFHHIRCTCFSSRRPMMKCKFQHWLLWVCIM